MSATKNWAHDYHQRFDAAWEALEEAIIKMAELNDTLYSQDGAMLARCPRADVSVLTAKLRELKDQVSTMENAGEPQVPLALAWPA